MKAKRNNTIYYLITVGILAIIVVLVLFAFFYPVCTVEFDTDGGSVIKSIRVIKGTEVYEPEIPKKSGYIFVGWYKQATAREKWNFELDVVSGDTVIYAVWREDIQKCVDDTIAEITQFMSVLSKNSYSNQTWESILNWQNQAVATIYECTTSKAVTNTATLFYARVNQAETLAQQEEKELAEYKQVMLERLERNYLLLWGENRYYDEEMLQLQNIYAQGKSNILASENTDSVLNNTVMAENAFKEVKTVWYYDKVMYCNSLPVPQEGDYTAQNWERIQIEVVNAKARIMSSDTEDKVMREMLYIIELIYSLKA